MNAKKTSINSFPKILLKMSIFKSNLVILLLIVAVLLTTLSFAGKITQTIS